jgi:hypothetical protein
LSPRTSRERAAGGLDRPCLLCVGIVVNNEDFNLAGVQSELSQYNSTRPRAAGMSVKGRMAVLFPQK